MEEVGQHQERPWPTSSQCSSPDLLGRTNPTRGDRAQGATAEREEVDETGNGNPTAGSNEKWFLESFYEKENKGCGNKLTALSGFS